MAYAANVDGLKAVRTSQVYNEFVLRAKAASGFATGPIPDANIDAKAITYAVRKLHAHAAAELATSMIPGTDRFLIEPTNIREIWGPTAAKIASSHHWSLAQLERELGRQGIVPLGNVGKGDPAYVACVLRLIDYAHINRDRASSLERALRQPLGPESLQHWPAQENIDGPERVGDQLVYRSSSPIADVDAWWLYYEMLVGLNQEIFAVRKYLQHRPQRPERLSLEGVEGTSSPESAAILIETSGFSPIEVNIRAGSIERLVQLLGGETLYGRSPMAAVRELIQNASDAVMLKGAVAATPFERAALTLPIEVKLKTSEPSSLEITDPGVGMSKRAMTEYLVSIASDYWNSEQFFSDFPSAFDKGFRPAGKFGIGFISVFMLGDEVQVESNRDGAARLRLTLRGVGRRGELREMSSPAGSGTSVKIRLKGEVAPAFQYLPELTKAYAPMVSHDIRVEVDSQLTYIQKDWWKLLKINEFVEWIIDARKRLSWSAHTTFSEHLNVRQFFSEAKRSEHEWANDPPEWVSERCRFVAHPRHNASILCSRGSRFRLYGLLGLSVCTIQRA